MRNLISISEVQERLHVCRSTVCRLIARGEISSVNIGRIVRIPSEDIDAFLQRSSVSGHRH